MNQQTAQLIIQFMNRVQLSGAEVKMWVDAMAALQSVAYPNQVVQEISPTLDR